MGYLYEYLVVFAAIASYELLYLYILNRRKKRIDNIKCDACGKSRKTHKSPDKKFWLCRSCLKVYKVENKEVLP